MHRAGGLSAIASRPRVRVAPTGVHAWLAQPSRSAERDLIEHLLGPIAGCAPDLRALAHAGGRPHAELARALFHLNRAQCLWVEDTPRRCDGDGAAGLAGLSADLETVVGGRGAAVIADRHGLCLAACGWQGRDADDAAAEAATWSVADGTADRWWFSSGQVTLAATVALDRASPGWIRIARRLLHACGPLSPEVPA